MLTRHAVRVAALFAGAGLASRFTFRLVETRWQIAAFAAVAAGYQLVVRPALGKRVSPASLAVDGAAIVIAIVGMKVAIEGHL